MGVIEILQKFQAGEAIVAVMLGNSIGMGHGATGDEILKNRYNDSRNFTVEYRSSGDIGHSHLLRQYLKAKNPNSELINLSGDGWDTNDHLGISLPSSSAPPHESTETVLASLSQTPDLVFIPLQINDANHEIPISVFAKNTRQLLTSVTENGSAPVIVKENYAEIEKYPRYVACAGEIAREFEVPVIDTYTPTLGRNDLLRDYAHPNQAGHQVIFDQYKTWLSSSGTQQPAEINPDACN